jgi:acyl-CoA-binding protein
VPKKVAEGLCNQSRATVVHNVAYRFFPHILAMNFQQPMDLQQQFEAAVARVDNLPGDQAAAHMTELYGLYKQATEGDHDTKGEVVGDDSPDNPSGTPGMSQAQWDSWSKFKGVSEDDAKRQYIEKVEEIAGPVGEQPSIVT